MAQKKEKVLVALSGGVDSSVAAFLLLRTGYQVSAAFMVNYEDKAGCWRRDYRDAVRVAAKLGIAIVKFDFKEQYKRFVLDYMYNQYEKGNTPNPDVLCNKFIKFGVWLEKARELGFNKLSTGHYAINNFDKNSNSWQLQIGKDKEKDQTYFLHQLSQQQLARSLFPIGQYNKKQVRQIAAENNLPTAEKKESMGICFVGKVSMKKFLLKRILPKPGKIVSTDGKKLGEHIGLPFYTIGQRHFGVSGLDADSDDKPLYVVEKRKRSNELVVGHADDPKLFKKKIEVGKVNWISGQEPEFPVKCEVRLRHGQSLQKCEIRKNKEKILVEFDKTQKAIAPGQFAVFYLERQCVGGGTILP